MDVKLEGAGARRVGLVGTLVAERTVRGGAGGKEREVQLHTSELDCSELTTSSENETGVVEVQTWEVDAAGGDG